MSKTESKDQSPVSAQEAMSQVLGAEESAKEAIHACEQEALKILQEAKHRAEHISKQADNRISHIHLRFKQCISRQVQELRREYNEQQKHIHTHHYKDSEIAEVVDRVAAILAGAGDAEPR